MKHTVIVSALLFALGHASPMLAALSDGDQAKLEAVARQARQGQSILTPDELQQLDGITDAVEAGATVLRILDERGDAVRVADRAQAPFFASTYYEDGRYIGVTASEASLLLTAADLERAVELAREYGLRLNADDMIADYKHFRRSPEGLIGKDEFIELFCKRFQEFVTALESLAHDEIMQGLAGLNVGAFFDAQTSVGFLHWYLKKHAQPEDNEHKRREVEDVALVIFKHMILSYSEEGNDAWLNNFNLTDDQERNILHWACHLGMPRLAALLIGYGVECGMLDVSRLDYIQLAPDGESDDGADETDLMDKLFICVNNGGTVLHFAALSRDVAFTEQVLACLSVDLFKEDHDGFNALTVAAHYDYHDIVAVITQHIHQFLDSQDAAE